MRKKGKIVVIILVSLLVIGFFLTIYITVDEEIPGNAVVVVTEEDKQYHSIHFDHICVAGKTAQTMTLSEAEAKGYKPHKHDEDLGYFQGNSQGLVPSSSIEAWAAGQQPMGQKWKLVMVAPS